MYYRILVPLLLFLVWTPWSAHVDLAVEQFFYTPGNPGHFTSAPFFTFMYEWAPYPALTIGWLAAAILLISYLKGWWSYLRSSCWICILTLVIGGGVITHLLLKDHWGRPRPRQVDMFGGDQPFRPYYSPNLWQQPEPSKSFPCGHCTTGFFFFAVALIGERYQSRALYYGGFIAAWLLGGALAVTRMAQGGHFLSDILAAALIMWETAVIVDLLLERYSCTD